MSGFKIQFVLLPHIKDKKMKYPNIIGREAEIATLERLYKSKKSEFVAIYGRRRIGKSFLVSEVYGSKIVFLPSEHT